MSDSNLPALPFSPEHAFYSKFVDLFVYVLLFRGEWIFSCFPELVDEGVDFVLMEKVMEIA